MSSAAQGRIVEFPSQGTILRGLLYEHGGQTPRATVLMTHGFSATIKGMVADMYAESLHAAGLNVLLVEHAGFGLSDGLPRQIISRWRELHEYRDALDFASTLPSVDEARMAVWGDSMSGASALGVAAFDERVKCVVVQVPACGSVPPPPDVDGIAFAALRETYGQASLPPLRSSHGPMAVVSSDQITAPSLLPPITAFRWFIDYGGRPGTGWLNQATLESSDTPADYYAGHCTPHMHAPSLWVVASDDEMPGAEPEVARLAFDSAPQPKEILEIEGGHFGLLYHPSPLFDLASRAQADFLVRHLLD